MAPDDGAVIRVENLSKTYQLEQQEVRALRGVSFAIMRNEFVAIMGPSGSGKSTLMNLIGCLDTPSEGTYHLNGKLVSSMGEDELAHVRNKEIGFIFQVFNLLARATAFRNVELPMIYAGSRKAEREERARRSLEMVEMKDRMRHKPAELSTTPRFSWPTSRPGTSIRRPGRRSSTCSTRSTPGGTPSSSSPTTARSPNRPRGSSTSRTG
jgi:putative ABC transport system ATP-binding protein